MKANILLSHFPIMTDPTMPALVCTGLHWAKVRIMAIEQNRTLPAIAAHIRNALRHVLLPMIRIIKRATETLPVASDMIANGWVIQLILIAFLSCAGSICR